MVMNKCLLNNIINMLDNNMIIIIKEKCIDVTIFSDTN